MDFCTKDDCNHYKKRAVIQEYQGGYFNRFDLPPDEFCSHPSTYYKKPMDRDIDYIGVRLQSLKRCPKTINK